VQPWLFNITSTVIAHPILSHGRMLRGADGCGRRASSADLPFAEMPKYEPRFTSLKLGSSEAHQLLDGRRHAQSASHSTLGEADKAQKFADINLAPPKPLARSSGARGAASVPEKDASADGRGLAPQLEASTESARERVTRRTHESVGQLQLTRRSARPEKRSAGEGKSAPAGVGLDNAHIRALWSGSVVGCNARWKSGSALGNAKMAACRRAGSSCTSSPARDRAG
jgi:hypothetical protein